MALLAATVGGERPALRLSLPAEPESLALLRGGWRASCTPRARHELEAYEITLTICEAAGNAIEHAYGPGDASFEVEVALVAGELIASVRDGQLARPARRAPRPRLKIIRASWT